MLKKTIPLVLATFIFAGCSLKMPSFSMPSFLQFEDKDLLSLEEANVCQKIESLDSKLTCYKKLLEKNNSYSQLRMGTYHADRKEYKDAIKYLNLSKENDNLYANLALAFLYYKGDGVEKNIDKSFELLEESSHKDPNAAYQLARFYLQGINTKIDNEKGIDLLEFSAQNGVFQAQELLSNVYKQGLYGVAKDQIKYEYWLNKATSNKEDKNSNIYIF